MVQIAEIQILLDLYVENINAIMDSFLILYGKQNPSKLWRYGLIDRTRVLDNDREFSLHGAGCTVENEDGEIVSFDFSEHDKFSFDLFKFEVFVSSKLPNNDEEVSKIFQTLKLYNEDGQWKVKMHTH